MRNILGGSLFKWRNFVVVIMAMILPVSALADDVTAAILRNSGIGVLVNNNPAPVSVALFPDDLIETQKDAVARIEVTGSAAEITAESVVQFEGDELVLEHGGVSVYTARGLRVRVGCLTMTPVNPSIETQYEVIDREGRVTVHATKSDVYIDARSKNPKDVKKQTQSSRDIVREGEQQSREEKCGGAYNMANRAPGGIGALINSPYAIWTGAAGIGVLTCWVLCRTDNPASPAKP